ncbi:hypothetical protein H9Q69_002985 [Fusarium xylarioides]|nr:hypothetical protein H9Q70_003652 [Fusarium xylarioides]KAG5785822.1 hypothetical protein H9Q73_000549 [Fusarium xylarioides]KAG5797980.1 hypothetical protein H9Q69_002985 [Fusarium xylarioides]
MSIAAAVATALEQYEFDEETGFNRLADSELPCLHCVLSTHRDGRLICVVDETPSRCSLIKKDHKKCTSAGPEIHDNATIEENIADTVTAYARECPEADAFVAAIERLPTAFETPVDGENDGTNAKFPPTNFNSINWLLATPSGY